MNETTSNELIHARRLYMKKNMKEAETNFLKVFNTNRELFNDLDEIYFIRAIQESHIDNCQSIGDLRHYADFVVENFNQEDCSNRNFEDPYADFILNLSTVLIKEEYYLDAIKYLIRLDESFLSDVSRHNSNGYYRFSHHEKYLSNMVKALIGIGKYDAALQYSIRLINDLPDTASEAKYWIKWSIAKIYNLTGDYELSIEYINELLLKRSENYFYKLLADNYLKLDDYDNALVSGVHYIILKKDIKSCVNYYTELGYILSQLGLTEESNKHYYLSYAIKKSYGNFIPDYLEEKIRDLGFDLENTN